MYINHRASESLGHLEKLDFGVNARHQVRASARAPFPKERLPMAGPMNFT
jgi:hypothetical protein